MAGTPIIVIVGPTASGKTSLSIELAERYNGEIISADSRAIYKGMDIGTAKPTRKEQHRVKHWGLDLVDPDERFTVYDFQQYALEKIADIKRRGKIPFLVGGSGLYIDSVIYNYEFFDDVESANRQRLAEFSVDDLIEYCGKNNIPLPENSRNKRYLMRAIETGGVVKNNRVSIGEEYTVVGITTDRDILRQRIADRAVEMFAGSIVKETTALAEKYSWQLESMKSNIYPIVQDMIDGNLTLEQAREKFVLDDWHLAKKQITWFKRNKSIHWYSLEDARAYIESLLDSSQGV